MRRPKCYVPISFECLTKSAVELYDKVLKRCADFLDLHLDYA